MADRPRSPAADDGVVPDRPTTHTSFEDEVDRFEPAGPGTLSEQRDLVDDEGDDIRMYTGEPVETDEGWVVPVQQNAAGRDNIAGGGEWPDPRARPAQPPPGDPQGRDPHDERKERGLPPGADTRGDDESRLRGNDREAAPYEEAPAEGKLAPGAPNPPP